MKTLQKIWRSFLSVFGIKRNSKYIKDYLDRANLRSGIYMAAVIVAIEIWLLIRQLVTYIIPKVSALSSPSFDAVFKVFFSYWGNYLLLMFVGFVMLFYCIQLTKEKYKKGAFITTLVMTAISIGLCALFPNAGITFSKDASVAVNTLYALNLVLYISIFLFDLAVIAASIYVYKGGKKNAIKNVLIVTLFAFACLAFGLYASYYDFAINKGYKDQPDLLQYKQVICFLMMSIYVGCLLIWKPYISLGILGTIFLGFYLLLKAQIDGGRRIPEGDEINYVTFFISLVMVTFSIYSQRVSEAVKDEELEDLATKDKITGLLSFEYFDLLAKEKMQEGNMGKGDGVYLFINIIGFKIYNDKKGFTEGNVFLKEVGEIISGVFPGDLISRQSDDHFVVFTKYENIEEKLEKVNALIQEKEPELRLTIKAAGDVTVKSEESPRICVEKARYAYAYMKNSGANKLLVLYDKKMHDNYLIVQYIVTHIDEAIANGYLKPYYQPVVWSKGRELCGVEALARWIDPIHGFLSPGQFIPALENAQVIYKLDTEILRLVCKDIRHNMDNGLPVIPVSINFSRADFGLIDIVDVVSKTVDEFNVPHELIHVEITESALTDETNVLKDTIKRLHEIGFATWLDDFGSGYSSFNVLKDFDFDVLKLDMAFLIGFDGNEKAKALIKSVISLADQIGMKTLCEGVETMEQAKFLEEASCGRLQGFLYGKPIPYQEMYNKIKAGEFKLAKDIKVTK